MICCSIHKKRKTRKRALFIIKIKNNFLWNDGFTIPYESVIKADKADCAVGAVIPSIPGVSWFDLSQALSIMKIQIEQKIGQLYSRILLYITSSCDTFINKALCSSRPRSLCLLRYFIRILNYLFI